MAKFGTNIKFTAQIEGHYNPPWSRWPNELTYFESVAGGGVEVTLPDGSIDGDRIPLLEFVAKLSPADAALITDRFRDSNFTDEQLARIMFFREGTPSEPQHFDIEKPLMGAL